MRAAFVLRLAGVVCVGLLAACAAEPAATPTDRGTTGPATEPSDGATSVRVEVSGGITGAHRVYELSRQAPPQDVPARAARAVLRLADTAAVRGLDDVGFEGVVPCCDRRVVDVTVAYADGDRTRVRTVEMASVPPQVRRIVELLTRLR